LAAVGQALTCYRAFLGICERTRRERREKRGKRRSRGDFPLKVWSRVEYENIAQADEVRPTKVECPCGA